MIYRVILTLLWFCLVIAIGYSSPAIAQELVLKLAADKQLYSRGEPVGVKLVITNASDSSSCVRSLRPNDRDFEILLTRYWGDTVDFTGLKFDDFSHDARVCVQPAETVVQIIDICSTHGRVLNSGGLIPLLDPGTYLLKCGCLTPSGETVWSNLTSFTVAISEVDDSTWSDFVKMDITEDIQGTRANRTAAYLKFLDQHPGSPQGAAVLSALGAVDRSRMNIYALRLLEEFPNSPLCGLAYVRLNLSVERSDFVKVLEKMSTAHPETHASYLASQLLRDYFAKGSIDGGILMRL